MLNKWERIQAVKILGLNTEKGMLVSKGKLSQKQSAFIKKYTVFSLRTFSQDDDDVHPHFPVIGRDRLLKELDVLTESGYSCIVATCINPKFAEFAGCAYKRGTSITAEIAYGAGTVRRVTHDGKIDKSFTTGIFQKRTSGDRRLDRIIGAVRHTPVDDCIFEFSWYNMPVGHKHQKMIFWEITGASTKGEIKTANGAILKI